MISLVLLSVMTHSVNETQYGEISHAGRDAPDYPDQLKDGQLSVITLKIRTERATDIKLGFSREQNENTETS